MRILSAVVFSLTASANSIAMSPRKFGRESAQPFTFSPQSGPAEHFRPRQITADCAVTTTTTTIYEYLPTPQSSKNTFACSPDATSTIHFAQSAVVRDATAAISFTSPLAVSQVSPTTLLTQTLSSAPTITTILKSTPTATPPSPTNTALPLTTDTSSTHAGDLTYYSPTGADVACTGFYEDGALIVALGKDLFDHYTPGTDPNQNTACGKRILIMRNEGDGGIAMPPSSGPQRKVSVWVADRCVACKPTDLDITQKVHRYLVQNSDSAGRVSDMTWRWMDDTEPDQIPEGLDKAGAQPTKYS